MASPARSADWPTGLSEMARLIREHDWAATPLGPVENWPERLRVVVELILATPQVASLAVGPERVLFYNDAAAQVYRGRHPGVLGRPLAEAFPESYPSVASLYDRAFAGETVEVAARPVAVSAAGGEVWDAILLPVRDGAGEVIAVQMTGTEVNAGRRAEERLRESEERMRLAIAATGLGTFDWDLATDRVVVNARFREIVGLPSGSEVIASAMMGGVVHPDDRDWVSARIAAAMEPSSSGAYEFEHRAVTPQGVRWLLTSGQVHFAGEGNQRRAVRIVGNDLDITERKRAEAALRQSDERFRTMADNAPVLIWETDGTGATSVNRHYTDFFGVGADEILGMGWADFLHPDDAPGYLDAYAEAFRQRTAYAYECRLRRADGEWRWLHNTGGPVAEDRFVGCSIDVTDLLNAQNATRESEARQAFLLRLSDALRPLGDPAQVQAAATALLRDELDAGWCYYVEWNEAGTVARVLRDATREGLPSLAGEHDVSDVPEFLDLLRTGAILNAPDYATFELLSPRIRGRYTALGFRSMLGVPLVKDGRLVATLILGDTAIRSWSDTAVALARETAERTWAAVEHARAEAALRESEARFATFATSSTDALWIRSAGTWAFEYVSPAVEAIYGVSPEAVLAEAELINGLLLPEDRGQASANVERVGRGEVVVQEYRIQRASDGVLRWIRSTGFPLRDEDGRVRRIGAIAQDITERRQAEAALRASETRLQFAMEATKLAAYEWDLVSDRLMANARFRELVGIGPDQPLIGAHIMGHVVHPDDRRRIDPDLARAMDGGSDGASAGRFAFEHRLNRAGPLGEPWVLSHGQVTFTGPEGDRRPARVFGTLQDITERKRVESALRESEERLRAFGEASSDVLWIRDAETLEWTYLSPAFEHIYGLSREAALAGDTFANWLDLILPDDWEQAAGGIGRVQKGERVTFEYRVRRPLDGEVRWLRNTDFPIRDADGRVTRIGGVGHDATAEKAAQAAMEGSERRLRTLMTGIPQLVWRAMDHGHWTWASPQWTAFTGQTNEASHGWGWLEPVHPDDREAARAAWERSRSTDGLEAEYRLREASSGTYRWFQTRATPVTDDHGRLLEWLGTSTDVQDLRELQERLKVLVAELQHRTRNLMGVVQGLTRKTLAGAASLEDFEATFHDRMGALARVNGLLSRLGDGDRVTFDELLEAELQGVGAVDASLGEAGPGSPVTLEGPEGVRLRSATVQTLALALHELATNAMKYGALAQPGGRLAVRWRRTRLRGRMEGRPGLQVEWTETGVAMPEAGAGPRGGGYGRELIERALPYQLGAETTYVMAPDGVHCTIALPLSSTETLDA